MQRDQASCLACGTEAPRSARSCPTCGYDVGRHDRRRLWLGGLGTALTLSLVLAPVGLPLLWLAHQHRRAAAGSVTQRADPSFDAHLRTVLRQFLALERTGADQPDIGRG